MAPRTLFDKIWDKHVVTVQDDGTAMLYIDKHFVIEVTSAQAYEGLRLNHRKVWRPMSIVATADHNPPTRPEAEVTDPVSKLQLATLDENVREFGAAQYYPFRDPLSGIAHVIGPEQGTTLPGMTVACGDSHTTTHGVVGALAFGVGTSEVELVLSTQCLAMKKPKNMLVEISGELQPGVSAKDLALYLIGQIGTGGGVGHIVEYAGETVRNMGMDGRATLCNMSVEAGCRAGLVAVDQTTIDFVRGRRFAPTGAQWDAAEAAWRDLHSDPGAHFDKVVRIDASQVVPQVTWGTSPELVLPIDGRVPDPKDEPNPSRRAWLEGALQYMGLQAGTPLVEIPVDKVFIGSCANSRIDDLRAAAAVVKGRKVAPNVMQALVVPGSNETKLQAEREGLDRIFTEAGFEWRASGCSMCVGINEDRLSPGERCASTSNRNFEGRQGPGGRSHLVSPAMAAAAAVTGHFADVRVLG
ncbi:3-isopropylmalate dehydratase large subunit [Pigmentiphaga soli]|uniref:3-isopropylmalate dehydratase large subunit n=1 Tax=Pigmentiphaga soli TaxID=1007095 RepID=A0ABP8HLR2_9BURK